MDRRNIYVSDKLVGTISRSPDGIAFRYAKSWIESGGAPISGSMPLDGSYDDATAMDFFRNLLPEGARKERIMAMTRIRYSDLVGWLAAYGEDLPGNISIRRAGSDDRLSDITERITRLVSAGASLDTLRTSLSLAGVEAKTAVILEWDARGPRFFAPTANRPSTHILKQAPQICILEAMCMEIVRQAGIDACETDLIPVAGKPILAIGRYDREFRDGVWEKVAQEDFCQILGKPSEDKYWHPDGSGVGNEDMLRVLESLPEDDRLEFMRISCASLILGNNDDHAKNYSVLHLENGDRLAPAYDIASATAAKKYVESCAMITKRLARPFGGEINPDRLKPEHALKHADIFRIPRRKCARLWLETARNVNACMESGIDRVIDDARGKRFSAGSMREIEDFGMLLKRHLHQRCKRFLKFFENADRMAHGQGMRM